MYNLNQGNIQIEGYDGLWVYKGFSAYYNAHQFIQYQKDGDIQQCRVSRLDITCIYHKGMDTKLWKVLNG